MKFPRRDEIWLVSLDPTQGSEIRKTRPGLVVSPNEANEYLRTLIIAPMTSRSHSQKSAIYISFIISAFSHQPGDLRLPP